MDGISKAPDKFEDPFEIDLRTTCGTSMKYSLKAVIAQAGNAIFGHYKYFINNNNGTKWLELNDELSVKVGADTVKSLNGLSVFAATSLLYVLK